MREAIKLAIEWIEKQPEEITASKYDVNSRYVVLRELEVALAQPEQDGGVCGRCGGWVSDPVITQPEQEPVAYIHRNEFNEYRLEPTDNFKITDLPVGVEMMLYTTPPQRTWVGLDNDEINNLAAGCHLGNSVQDAIYKAVAKLKDKNT